jgi:hypothetical protein
MILRHEHLAARPTVFAAMTGLSPRLFGELAAELTPRLVATRAARRQRPGRLRAPGAGHPFELATCDALLLTIVWLRHYPILEVLGYLFGVSKATACRTIAEALPLLEAAGRDSMRLPDPGRGHRRSLPELLDRVPELAALLVEAAPPPHSPACRHTPPVPAVLVDSFEQAVQRPGRRAEADLWSSGKKRMHTIKTQLAVCEATGRIVAVCGDAVGPFSDLTLLAASGLARRLPAAVPLIGDGGYLGMAEFRSEGLALTPRRHHPRRPLTEADRAYNRWLASRRVWVEHGVRRLRTYQALSQRDRHRRRGHERRVVAVAGLTNRRMGFTAAG